ncbi:hypothetical protein I547_0577 [Mycobacterium kansasii 824]|uniref:Uncharacterized protein n=1 Tax=Mycobacterium kansasii TaxID=1768 RepID=A0A1V3XTD9_MYCKA|nr:hypothetical protein I547_0577 [Mycobacterium kansasii 824]OOK82348.1 hypothetical protein BZL30_1029 [Mycobacterium kansasii]
MSPPTPRRSWCSSRGKGLLASIIMLDAGRDVRGIAAFG